MSILNTACFNMDVLARDLGRLRQQTETTHYVHDMTGVHPANSVLSVKPVMTAGNQVAQVTVRRLLEIKDGDILVVRDARGRELPYYVFDVVKSPVCKDKYEMCAVLWQGAITGFGLRGQGACDNLHGRNVSQMSTLAAH